MNRPTRRLLLGASTPWLRWLFVAAGWLAVAVGVFGMAARSGTWQWQPLIVAAAFFPYLILTALLGAVMLATQRVWAGVVVAALLLVVTVTLRVPTYLANGPGVAGGRPLRALQANLRVGAANPGALVDLVRTHHIDVLTVDELTAAELRRLTAAGLSARLPYHLATPYPGGAGTGIWSRYPLTRTGRDDRYSFELLTALVTVPGAGAVRIIAVHLLPPWPYPSATWTHEFRLLHRRLDTQPAGTPVIVSGDFNATLDHAQLRGLLTGGYHDAGDQAGVGTPATYPTDRHIPPLLPLDHVLVRSIGVRDIRTLTLPGSDHRALFARLSVGG